jgi:hypothetical protein
MGINPRSGVMHDRQYSAAAAAVQVLVQTVVQAGQPAAAAAALRGREWAAIRTGLISSFL